MYKRVNTCGGEGWDQSHSTIPRTRLRISTAKEDYASLRIVCFGSLKTSRNRGLHHPDTDDAKSTNSRFAYPKTSWSLGVKVTEEISH
jgi:hypothetical protein